MTLVSTRSVDLDCSMFQPLLTHQAAISWLHTWGQKCAWICSKDAWPSHSRASQQTQGMQLQHSAMHTYRGHLMAPVEPLLTICSGTPSS